MELRGQKKLTGLTNHNVLPDVTRDSSGDTRSCKLGVSRPSAVIIGVECGGVARSAAVGEKRVIWDSIKHRVRGVELHLVTDDVGQLC